MVEQNELQKIFESITNLTVDDEKIPQDDGVKIKDKLNTLNIATDDLINYWNESVKQLANKIDNYYEMDNFKTEENGEIKITGDINGKRRDAGYSFSNSPYVNPNQNIYGNTYEESRTDEIKSVLQNKDFLDYTVDSKNKRPQDLSITRLLMPQYARRVEIEDLNRNFWVIGQNLSAINTTISNLNDEVLQGLLSEIAELWQNVYRLWQAIAYLYKYVNDLINSLEIERNKEAKIKVKLTYGFGTSIENQLEIKKELEKSGIVRIDNKNAKYFGILPYIKEAKVVEKGDYKNRLGYVYYMPYNRLLTDYVLNTYSEDKTDSKFSQMDLEFLNNDEEKDGLNLIQIDSKYSTRDTRTILEQIRSRNFVLVYLTNQEITYLPSKHTFSNPYYNYLRFYRDFLYYVSNSDVGQPLSQTLTDDEDDNNVNLKTWVQIGGLKYLNLNEDSQKSYIKDNVIDAPIDQNLKNCCLYLYSSVDETFPSKDFLKCIIKTNNLEELKAYIDDLTEGDKKNETIFNKMVDDFYKTCQYYLSDKEDVVFPEYFCITKPYILSDENTAESELIVSSLIDAAHEKDKVSSFDSKGNFSYLSKEEYQKLLNNQIQWDLVSAVFDEDFFDRDFFDQMTKPLISLSGEWSTGQTFTKDEYGSQFLYPRKEIEHLWIDFVENAYYDKSIISNSKIGSFTFNDFSYDIKEKEFSVETETLINVDNGLDYQPLWIGKLSYDLNISIPFTTPANIAYEDFVRIGKPYPNIREILRRGIDKEENIRFEIIEGTEQTRLSKTYYNEMLNNCYAVVNKNLFDKIKNYNQNYTSIIEENGKIAIDGFFGQGISYDEVLMSLENHHPPVFYLNCLQYGISSSDLIDYTHDEKGQTRKNNFILLDNPNLNLRYISSNHNWQEIEVVLTKDKTGLFKIPIIPDEEPEPTPDIEPQTEEIGVKMVTVRIGDFYPIKESTDFTIIAKDSSGNIINHPINLNTVFTTDYEQEIATYDINTFGLGSYHMTPAIYRNLRNSAGEVLLKYVDYDDYINKRIKYCWELNKLTYNEISNDENSKSLLKSGKDYLEEIIKTDGYYKDYTIVKEKIGELSYSNYLTNSVVVTKLGKRTWLGSSGSQWEGNILCHLYYIFDNTIIPLCLINRIDGYFDGGNGTVLSKVSQTGYRHLVMALDAKPNIKSTKSNEKTYYAIPKILTGYVFWFDRNQTGTWNSTSTIDQKHNVCNDVILPINSYLKNENNYYHSKRKWSTQNAVSEFKTFVKSAFFQIPENIAITIEDKAKKYERLVAYAPFKIENNKELNEQDEQILNSINLSLNDYTLIHPNEQFVGNFELFDKYTLIRQANADINGKQDFQLLYNEETNKINPTFSNITSILPIATLYDKEIDENKQSFNGQTASFVLDS